MQLKKSNYKEPFCSELFRLLVGLHQPKVRNISGKVGSQLVPGFKQLAKLKVPLTIQELINGGVIRGLVLNYFISNPDIHGENVGVDKNGKIIWIDFDNALFFLYKLDFVNKHFDITAENIRSIPSIQAFVTDGWSFINIDQDPRFQYELYKSLLMIAVLNKQILQNIANEHFPRTDSEKDRILQNLEERRSQLEKILPTMKEFREFLSNYPDVINQLMNEFMKYNAPIVKKILKFKERIKIFSDAKQDHTSSDEYKQLIQKTRYKNLTTREEFVKEFTSKIKLYEEKLVKLTAIQETFESIKNAAEIIDITAELDLKPKG